MPPSPSSLPILGSDGAVGGRPTAAVLRVAGLAAQFGNRLIFHDVDLDLRRGEILGVVGASGAGKSVLLRTILGLSPAAAGSVEFLGARPAALDRAARHRLDGRIGVLFQDGALFSSLSVVQNIAVPLAEHLDLPRRLIDDIALLKLAMVGLPPEAAPKLPAELSGGMRKRAGLARALALDPELLVLDEPTAGLDPIAAAEFDSLIGDLQRSMRLSVLMVTHDLDSIFAICKRVAVLVDHGLRVGTLDQLLGDPHPWIRAYFHGPRGRAAAQAAAG